jgi:hypothetical protein
MTDTQTAQNRYPNRWPGGTSGNPRGGESKAAREARISAIVADWTRPYGGPSNLPPANVLLLRRAADLSLQRPRRIDEQVRPANSISKLMAQAGIASCREPPFEPLEQAEPEREYAPGEVTAEIMAKVAEAITEAKRGGHGE